MKILITGCNGQLGKEIINIKPKGVDLIETPRSQLDLSKPHLCENFVLKIKPDWIINCAAYTNVDKAEEESNLAYLINSLSVKNLANAIKKINGNFIQISTDYVFDGKQKKPYLPNQSRSPLNVYGKTKALGEDFVLDTFKNTNKGLIIRTSWLMGSTGMNFALKMLNLFDSKNELNIINDQIGAPTTTSTLAKACWESIKAISEGKKLPSILHITNYGEASWYDLALKVYDLSQTLKLISSSIKINPIKSSQYPSLANRPKYSVLDCQNSFKFISLKNQHWEKALEQMLYDYKENMQ